MGKAQQIKDLTEQLAKADELINTLTAEKAGLADALALSEKQISQLKKRLPESLERSLSEKTINRARDILTRAMERGNQLTADAQLRSDELYAQACAKSKELIVSAKAKANMLLKSARDDADTLKATAHISVQAMKDEVEAARREAIALRDGAQAAVELAAKSQRVRTMKALSLLSHENEALLCDIRRQASALMTALCETTDQALLSESELDDIKSIFSDNLSEVLKASPDDKSGDYQLSGVVALHSRAEFEALGTYGFRNNALLNRVSLPDANIIELPDSFFFGCTNLNEVSLPTRMAYIGDYAFFSCVRLQSILLPRELEQIGAYAFSCCHTLSTLRIPGGVKKIGIAAFRSCEDLTEVILDSNGCLATIGSHAFQNCARLTSFTLPKGLTTLPTSLFYGCERLETMDIPANIERMQSDVFGLCTSLRRVDFHNPDLVLEPGATAGLERAQLSLSGRQFLWAEVSEETTLRQLIDSHAIANSAAAVIQSVTKDAYSAFAKEEEINPNAASGETGKAASSDPTKTPAGFFKE